ncbi:MAG TPA: N-formylglutamate amidohydrolase [Coriobacteriia bacterium]|nr:N-formylglutamate amidohydrolase [Coriobacteriia bacterium]
MFGEGFDTAMSGMDHHIVPFVVSAVDGGPVISSALHAGHLVRESLRPYLALGEEARRREEDPHTDVIADVGVPLVRVAASRFEVDMNRPRDRAIYRDPEDAWGLRVWEPGLPSDEVAASLRLYDLFYDRVEALLCRTVASHGAAVVIDVHSYNHRRRGAEAADDPELSPEVNLGTGTLDHERWRPAVERFMRDLTVAGLEVGENVRFQGGHFAAWAHERFSGDVAVLAVEFKKTFMDEWTGEADRTHITRLRRALAATVPALRESLGRP